MLARIVRLAVAAISLVTAICSPISAQQNATEEPLVQRSLQFGYEADWLAERNGTRVTLMDIEGRIQEIPQNERALFVSSPERIARILNDLLANYGLAEQAIARGLLEDPEVRAELVYRAMYVLARHERQALLAERELEDYSARAHEYYLANPDEFRNLEQLDFTHVLFRAESTLRPAAREAAEALLDAIESPEHLDDVGLEPFAVDGVEIARGTLTDTTLSQLDARFGAGLERMEPGELALLESSFGFHVVRLDARRQGGTRSFEEVRPMLEARARQRHHDQILRQRMEAFYAAPLNLAEGAVERIIESQAPASDD